MKLFLVYDEYETSYIKTSKVIHKFRLKTNKTNLFALNIKKNLHKKSYHLPYYYSYTIIPLTFITYSF